MPGRAPADEGAPPEGVSTAAEARAKAPGWIRDLGAEEFEVRERARQELQRWADDLRDLLEAEREHADPEVRRAVRALLEARPDPGTAAPPPREGATPIADLARVTLATTGTLDHVLRALGEAVGGRVEAPPEARERPVEVRFVALPFFAAVEDVARQAGLVAASPFDPGGSLSLVAPDEDAEAVPSGSLGPLRLRVLRVSSTRAVGSTKRKYSLALQLQWCPGVEVVSYRSPVLLEAKDPGGAPFAVPSGPEGTVTYGVAPGATAGEMQLSLEPAAPGAEERLASLEVRVHLRVRHGRQEVRFAGLDAPRTLAVPREAAGGRSGAEVVLRRAGRPDGERGPWVAEVTATLEAETASRSARLLAEQADGTAVPMALSSRSTTADGSVQLTGRAWRPDEEAPTGVRVAWFTAEGEGEARFRLADVPLR